MKKLFTLLFTVVLFSSCKNEPQPIAFGHDACHFCAMTIVDPAYAAQVVSSKGKQFKYDAIECMVNDLANQENPMAISQVSDFSNPGSMLNVQEARFVINDSLKSPMGKNLAAVKNSDPNVENTFSWKELKAELLRNESASINHH